jgi:predicted RNA-binding Zn-ribbon protein involved in translation (DUF1610 family)
MELEKKHRLISRILQDEFKGNPGKQEIHSGGNRFNFSCPYCGDSSESRKKRGNFYIDTNSYKCYNGGCGIYKDGENFFRDFGVFGMLSDSEKKDLREITQLNKDKRISYYGDIDISLFFDTDINEVLIDRRVFMEKLGLINVNDSKILTYINRRNQKPDNKFAWDPRWEKLYLFNLTKSDKILGLQVRNMNSTKGSSKYYTYKLSGIWEKLLKCKDDEFLEKCKKIDPVSHVFNLGMINFNNTITIFEGPMDSWLWHNSVGLCSIENKFPFEMENLRYWDDWDDAGRNKSVERLSAGFSVFNWGKFLEENELTKNKKWDLNDLVNHLRRTGKKIKRLDNYFTDDRLDLRYFING